MRLVMISCRKATELIDKKIFSKLSVKERIQLFMHKAICDACTLYDKQSVFIDKALKKQTSTEKDDRQNLSENTHQLQSKIIRSLEE
jgi:hypothetical protein